MHFKICTKCRISNPLTNFYMRRTGSKSGKSYEVCKNCMKLRGRTYYSLNRERQLSLSIIRRNKNRNTMRKFLMDTKDKPCMDCGLKFPHYVLDFHHRDGNKKVKEVTRMVLGGWSKVKIQKEIEKCDLICANCHRIRTYYRSHAEVAKVVTARV